MKMIKQWTEEEIQYLKDHYKTMKQKDIADAIGRTQQQVAAKMNKIGLYKFKNWEKEEVDFLKRNYTKMSYEEIAEKLNRSKGGVALKASECGLSKNKHYSKEESMFIVNNFETMSAVEIAQKLNKPVGSVKSKILHLGLIKKKVDCREGYTTSYVGMSEMMDNHEWSSENMIEFSEFCKMTGIEEKTLKYFVSEISNIYKDGTIYLRIDSALKFMKNNPNIYDATKCEEWFFICHDWYKEKLAKDSYERRKKRWGEFYDVK